MVIEVPGVVRSWLTLTTGERVPLQIEWENEQEIAGLELDAIGWPMYRRWIIARRMVVRRERLVVDTDRGFHRRPLRPVRSGVLRHHPHRTFLHLR